MSSVETNGLGGGFVSQTGEGRNKSKVLIYSTQNKQSVQKGSFDLALGYFDAFEVSIADIQHWRHLFRR